MAYPVTNFVGKAASDCGIIRGIGIRGITNGKTANEVKPNIDDSIQDETFSETMILYIFGKFPPPECTNVVKAFIYIAEINVEGSCATLVESRLEFKLVIVVLPTRYYILEAIS
jgi:hypothetical protein